MAVIGNSMRRPGKGTIAALHDVWLGLAWIGLLTLVIGLTDQSALLVAVSAASFAFAFVANDTSRVRQNGVTPITIFAIISGLTSLANATGFAATDSATKSVYFLYAAEDKLFDASMLAWTGVVLPVFGFWLIARSRRARSWLSLLPSVSADLSDRTVVSGALAAGALGIAIHMLPRSSAPGTITALVYLLPQIAAFTLARRGADRNRNWLTFLALVLTVLEATRAVMFDYLRANMIAPFIVFVLGLVIGARSLRPLRSRMLLPGYVFAAAFVVYFSSFGTLRSQTGSGFQRLATVVEQRSDVVSSDEPEAHQTVWSRLTNFNQLSQVARIADTDGYLHGATLKYMAFVFVPRFIWPNKPVVAEGGWFAWRIGQALIKPNGNYSNSINMTIAGELFLNFGPWGAVVGCFAYGAVFAAFWSTTHFWRSSRNALGSAYGCYLFWVGAILGADLQIVVTMLAMYVIFVAAARLLRLVTSRRSHPTPVLRPLGRPYASRLAP